MSKTLHGGMFGSGIISIFSIGGDWSGNDENGHSGSQHGNWWNIHDEHEGFPPSQVCWPSKSTVSKEMDIKQISGKTQTWWFIHKFLWIPSRENHLTWWNLQTKYDFISTIQPLSALFLQHGYPNWPHFMPHPGPWSTNPSTSHPWLVFLSLFHLVVGVGSWPGPRLDPQGNCRLEI